jgi:hypothetical protein
MRKINFRTSLDSLFLPTCFLTFEIRLQYSRNPARCQRTTVSGVTTRRDFFQSDQNRDASTQKSLSTMPSLGLKKFVSSRFLLLPAFCSLYYFQLWLGGTWPKLRSVCLLALIAILVVAIPANWLWIVDFRKRLKNGFKYLNQTFVASEPKEMLEQMRWCNVQILGIVLMILGILSQYRYVEKVPTPHKVPALALVLLILIALFDAVLDLQAEWIISVLGAVRVSEPGKLSLPKAVWKVNQYRPDQERVYDYAVDGKKVNVKGNTRLTG